MTDPESPPALVALPPDCLAALGHPDSWEGTEPTSVSWSLAPPACPIPWTGCFARPPEAFGARTAEALIEMLTGAEPPARGAGLPQAQETVIRP